MIDIQFTDSIAIVLVGIIAILLLKVLLSKQSKLPPGPIGLPIVGYAPFLGNEPHVTLLNLSKKYGNVMSLRFGLHLTVVLTDYESTKEAFNHSSTLDRSLNIFDNLKGLGFGDSNGDEWIEQRRFSVKIMRDLGLGRGLWEKLVREEVTSLLDILSSTKGQPYDAAKTICSAINHNILSLLIGRRFQDTEKDKIDLAIKYSDVSFTYNGPSNVASIVPGARRFLEFFNISGYRTAANIISNFVDMLKDEVKKHLVTDHKEDFMQLYINKMEKETEKKTENYFTMQNLIGNVNVLFLGAGDTIFSTLTWLIAMMAKYQEIQQKIQHELDDVIGRDGWISYEQRQKIPYTIAVFMECLRFTSIVPLSPTRQVRSDFELQGYTIPKGTHVTSNFFALHSDPKYWKEPNVFRPERFLDSDGKVVNNLPSYVPFSIGRRNCPGETVAWMEILAFFTSILQKFHIRPVPGQNIKFDKIYGLVVHLVPQEFCFVERN